MLEEKRLREQVNREVGKVNDAMTAAAPKLADLRAKKENAEDLVSSLDKVIGNAQFWVDEVECLKRAALDREVEAANQTDIHFLWFDFPSGSKAAAKERAEQMRSLSNRMQGDAAEAAKAKAEAEQQRAQAITSLRDHCEKLTALEHRVATGTSWQGSSYPATAN